MTKIIDGRNAEITNSLQVYTNWVTLATKHGYPKAAYVYGTDPRKHLNDGDTVTVLTSTFVHDGAMIWVVQARNGEQFLYSEKGLRILPEEPAPISLLPDESLGGLMREYREVKRKACVGELVKVTDKINGNQFPLGEVVRMTSDIRAEYLDKHDWWAVDDSEYVVLEASDILRIDDPDGVSRAYRMVDRKAAVGERVIIVKADDLNGDGYGNGALFTADTDDGSMCIDTTDGVTLFHEEYAILEPLTQESAALSTLPLADQYAENITVLTRKIAQLESRILALETDSAVSVVKVASGPVDNALPTFAEMMQRKADVISVKTPQQIRDEIVERAKADVGDLRKFSGKKIPNDFVSFWPKTELPHAYIAMHTVEFVVNSAKRTVAVIIRCTEDGLTTRGIAKCAPGETFNSHIGRAIALYRALGRVVPAKYLNAPQPEEVRVGDVIRYEGNARGPLVVSERVDSMSKETHLSTARSHYAKLAILDDSREDSGVTAASASSSPRKEAA
ncbi:hypothetical protein [Paenibacillus sp. Marseille-Q9583]